MMSKLAKKKATDCEGEVLQGKKLKQFQSELGPSWKVLRGKQLQKELKFKDFREALAYTNRVGEIAESLGHHPDIFLAWGKVKLTIWTHSKGGLTENDFGLAAKVDEIH